MSFAVGRYSQAICDRCGFAVKYLELKQEWNGLRVCDECFEPKHPQLEPPYASADAEALEDPRPQVNLPMTVEAGIPNDTFFTSNGMQPSIISDDLNIISTTGILTVIIT
tara:strand:+ start:142 stop:471 length:330 start_codon:yes stop_codon:yes gene_type:complete